MRVRTGTGCNMATGQDKGFTGKMRGIFLPREREQMISQWKKCLSILVVALLVAACGADEQAAKYLQKGKAFYQEGNYDKARIELKNTLQINPKSIEGHYYLGLTYEQQQNLQKAFSHFLAVLELDPKSIPGRLKVAKYYLLSQQNDKAMELVRSLLADEPRNPEAIALEGAVLARQGDSLGAVKRAEEAYRLAPDNAETILLLSSLYQGMKQGGKAIAVLKNGLERVSDTELLRRKLIEVYWQNGETAALEKLLRDSIGRYPDNRLYRAQLAHLYVRLNRPDDAEKVLRDAVAESPEDEERELLLVRFLRERRSLDKAEQELHAFIKRNPRAYKARFVLAEIYREKGQTERAEKLYREIIEEKKGAPEAYRAMNELAILHLAAGKRTEAESLITEVLANNPRDPQALLTRGRIVLEQGDAKKAIADFRTILQDNPGSVPVLILLANANLRNNAPELAEENLRKAIKIDPRALEAHYTLINLLVAQKAYDQARDAVRVLLEVAPSDRRGLQAMVDLYALDGDWKHAEEFAQKLIQAYPREPAGHLKQGQIFLANKRYDAALRELERAVDKAPGEAGPVISLVRVYVAKGERGKAISRLQREIKRSPANRAGYYNLLGELYLSAGEERKAMEAFGKAISAKKGWLIPVRNLAMLHASRGDSEEAVKLVKKATREMDMDDEATAVAVAGLYETIGAYEEAIQLYDEILSRSSNNEIVANNLAALLTEHRSDTASLQRALKLASRFEKSANPNYLDTIGWIYYKLGKYDKATDLLKKAVKQSPNTAIFNYHLGMAYRMAGEKELARQHLRAALDSKADFWGRDEARRALRNL